MAKLQGFGIATPTAGVEDPAVLTLLLIRHGESTANAERRHQGHLDCPLSDEGRRQAAALAPVLAPMRPDMVLSSDLRRAVETASLAMPRHHIRQEPRLRELHVGCFQGLLYDEARIRHPQEAERYWSRDPAYRLPEGESSEDLAERMMSWANELAASHSTGLIIAVTHGGAIQCMVCRTVGHPLRDRDGIATPNCGIHRFTWDGSWHWRGVDGAADAIAVDGPPT